jgi:hypothetical protein
MSLKQVITITLCFVAIIALTLTISHLSLWFLWNLSPSGEIQVVVDQSNQAIASSLPKVLPSEIKEIAPGSTISRKFSFYKHNDKITILAIPAHPFLFSSHKALTNHFNNMGWSSYHLGLIIIAEPEGKQALNSLSHTWFRSLRELIRFDRPFHPFIIAELASDSILFIDTRIALIGYAKQGPSINILTAPTESELSQNNIDNYTQTKKVDELQVAIKSQSLGLLPVEMQQQWNVFYAESFGFHKTKPKFIESLFQHETIYLGYQSNNPVIVIKNNPQQFIDTAKEWVQDEESYSRPQKRAFQLPDKTLGYEQIPGDPRDVFKYDDNQCQHASWPDLEPNEMLHLWLCENDSQVALARSKETALKAATQAIISDGQWHIHLGSKYAPSLSGQLLNSLSVTGNDIYTAIQLQLSAD